MTEYVVMPGSHYQEICNALREKTGDTQPICSGQIAGRIADLYEDYYNFFWDSYQDNGNRTFYTNGFSGIGWNDETFVPKYNLVIGPQNSGRFMFENSKITDLKGILEKRGIVMDISNTTETHSLFYGMLDNTRLPKVDYSHIPGRHYQIFANSPKLEEIEEYVVSETSDFVNVFTNCPSLSKIKITGTIGNAIAFPQSSLLSAQSVQSVIDCLKDLTGAATQTLTFHADVGARMTPEQKATIIAKNWTLVY